jgi:hypothetical protein
MLKIELPAFRKKIAVLPLQIMRSRICSSDLNDSQKDAVLSCSVLADCSPSKPTRNWHAYLKKKKEGNKLFLCLLLQIYLYLKAKNVTKRHNSQIE